METTNTTQATRTPAELATAVNAAYSRVNKALGQALLHARTAGQALIEAKEVLPHGQYTPWIKAHCHVNERMASNYVRIAEQWDAVVAPALTLKPELSITSALVLLQSGPRRKDRLPPSTPAQEQWTASVVATRKNIIHLFAQTVEVIDADEMALLSKHMDEIKEKVMGVFLEYLPKRKCVAADEVYVPEDQAVATNEEDANRQCDADLVDDETTPEEAENSEDQLVEMAHAA